MKTFVYYLLFVSVIISFLSCQDIYVNEDLNAAEDIPVIEGLITNSKGPHQILLYYARPYYETGKKFIPGATVYVNDDIGNTFYFTEYSSGVYRSDSTIFSGILGRSYTLFVELPDGKILKSDPELLMDTLTIEKIIKKKESREEYYRNYENKIIVKNINGESNYAVISSNSEKKEFYRLTSYYYVYSTTQVSSTTFKTVIVNNIPYEFVIDSTIITKCVTPYMENGLPKIGQISPNNSEDQMELSFFILSLDHYLSNPESTFMDEALHTYVYTISKNAYDYYEALTNQLNATSRLYDPLPTQLTGNMHCESDSNQIVLGLFEVSSHTLNKSNVFPYYSGCVDSVSSSITPVENMEMPGF